MFSIETLHLHQTTRSSTGRLDSAHYTDTTPAHCDHPPECEGPPDVPQLGCEQLGTAVLRLLASDALTNIFC